MVRNVAVKEVLLLHGFLSFQVPPWCISNSHGSDDIFVVVYNFAYYPTETLSIVLDLKPSFDLTDVVQNQFRKIAENII